MQEQQTAIRAHASRHGLTIVAWFEEKETAAKLGRQLFSQMLSRLEKGEAQGVIIHKIDRSARNLKDWANLGSLVDRGIDVQFVHESVDLNSRGGRLSADIMAVVAADYVRNLRDEVKKGFYGRLKQGYYPLPAPIGYLDCGKARVKIFDPERAPLVKAAFERYATGNVSGRQLAAELARQGLRPRRGHVMSLSTLMDMFDNPFYIGLIRIKRTGEIFEGLHRPLISKSLFDRVQAVKRGKAILQFHKHEFAYKSLIRCSACGRLLSGERQKSLYVYYRCHSTTCKGISVSEHKIDDLVSQFFSMLRIEPDEVQDIGDLVDQYEAEATAEQRRLAEAIELRIAKIAVSLSRLTDALIDAAIEKDAFNERRGALLAQKKALEEQIGALNQTHPIQEDFKKFELGNTLILHYEMASPLEKRETLQSMSSNFFVQGKKLGIALYSPWKEVVFAHTERCSGPCRYNLRTFSIFEILKECAWRQFDQFANDNDVDLDERAAS